MKPTLMLLSLCAGMSFSAAAQTYAQPVRDIDSGVRSGAYGYCSLTISAGFSGSGLQNCTLGTFTSLSPNGTVPDGKILIIEEASANCRKNSADDWSRLIIHTPHGQRLLPLNLQGASGSTQAWASHTTGRLHVAPTRAVKAQIDMIGNTQYSAYCTISYSGYLVDA
jgi:hypothetical protein